MKLKCLGSRPHGRRPIFVEELHRLVAPGEVFPAKDETWARMVCDHYPGCFAVVAEEKVEVIEKTKRNTRDKMLPANPVEKESD